MLQGSVEQSAKIYAVILVAGAAQSITIPTGYRQVIFSGSDNFFVNIGGSAAIPVANVLDGTASELNPIVRSLEDKAAIGLISAVNCTVTLAFYK